MPAKKRAQPGSDEQKQPRRLLRRRSTETAVERTISEHFGDFPKAAVELEQRDGHCLRDRLLMEKRAKGKGGRLSKGFLQKMRQKYAPAGSLHTQLAVKDPGQAVSPALRTAMDQLVDANPAKRSKDALLAWLSTTHGCNQRECVALCRWVAAQNPARQPASRTVMMKVLDFFCRGALYTTFAEEMGLMQPVWDHLLATQYSADKKERMSAPTWWVNFGYMCRVLACYAELDAIFVNYGDWVRHADRLAKVCKSHLGERLFGQKHQEVAVLKASDDMVHAVQAFPASPTTDDVNNLQATLRGIIVGAKTGRPFELLKCVFLLLLTALLFGIVGWGLRS